MNTKLVVLLGSAGAIHLVVGGLFLAGGCTQEDPPMPPGIYVPRQPVSESQRPAVSETPAYPTTEPVMEPERVQSEKPVDVKPVETQKPASQAAGKDSGHGDKAYIVVKNDSLWLIARKNGLTIEELASYNNLPANAKLKIGQKLYIPATGKKAVNRKAPAKAKAAKGGASARKGKKAAGKNSTAEKRGKNLPADGIYIVKAGDNFSTIAKRHGLKVSDIMSANPGVDSSRLKVGQKLRLTADAASIPPAKKKTAAKKNSAKKEAVKETVPGAAAQPKQENAKQDEADDLLNKVEDVKSDSKATDGAASSDAVKAVVSEQDGSTSVIPDKDRVVLTDNGSTEVVIGEDTTLEKFCKKFRVEEKTVRKLNSGIPKNGTIKTGSRIRLIAEDDGGR
ncbi:MAG: LysM peptidoglycan-binding domain-containing protein [Lentisphaeria bacterium]|nr:LysM peptidoglycan-binding domain-containing protein [Lentisphaeria bacterium]